MRPITNKKDSPLLTPQLLLAMLILPIMILTYKIGLLTYSRVFDVDFFYVSFFWKNSNYYDNTPKLSKYLYCRYCLFQDTYRNWMNGEPNNDKGVEHCTIIAQEKNDEWNDARCDDPDNSYVCKKKRKCC